MLRSLPMTPEQVVQLRLFPDCGIQDEITFFVDGNDNDEEQVGSTFSYIEPHLPFSGILSPKNAKMLIDVMKMGMADHLQPFEHRTICNHFGPLGPSFRGRDRVESMSMHLCSLTRDFKKLSCTPCLSRIQDFDLVPEHTGPLYRWFRAADGQEAANIPHPEDEDGANTGFVSSSWMLRLSRECYRNRPMNVEPPLVTLECYLDN